MCLHRLRTNNCASFYSKTNLGERNRKQVPVLKTTPKPEIEPIPECQNNPYIIIIATDPEEIKKIQDLIEKSKYGEENWKEEGIPFCQWILANKCANVFALPLFNI